MRVGRLGSNSWDQIGTSLERLDLEFAQFFDHIAE